MKKLLSLILFTFVFLACFGQIHEVDLYYKVSKNYAGWKSGRNVHLTGVKHVIESTTLINPGVYSSDKGTAVNDSYFLFEEGSNEEHAVKSKFEGAMSCDYRKVQDIWDDNIIGSVLVMLQKKGTQVSLRAEMEEDAIEFIKRLQVQGSEFNDPYLENYLYSLVAKIAPSDLIDGRPGNVNLIIMSSQVPNAFTFANGTIVLTTSLLSMLHTEDELVAILSHEIAHFVMDHSVQNVNDAIKRQKQAEFWASLATIATAAAEGVAASKNNYYVPGAATASMAMMTVGIANQIIDRLGMNFNHEQEEEADRIAIEVLKLLNYDSNALASALHRLQIAQEAERSKSSYLSSTTHPALVDRIKKLGTPSDRRDAKFEKMISFAITSSAIKKYDNRRFRQVLPLVNQNIENGVALADDYILKANCLLALKNDAKSNQEVLDAINMAKNLDKSNINIYKAEIIASLRLDKKNEAMKQLDEYLSKLQSLATSMSDIRSEITWDSTNDFVNAETIWAENMKIKLRGM